MIAEGNFDSEGGSGAQMFPAVQGGVGNVQSDTSNWNAFMGDMQAAIAPMPSFGGFEFKGSPQSDYYGRLGEQLMQLQRQQQQMAAQQAAQQQIMPPEGQLGLSAPNIVDGFDMNWLSQRLAAGSANGAKITGMAGGPKGGGKKEKKPTGEKGGWEDSTGGGGPGIGGEGSTAFV